MPDQNPKLIARNKTDFFSKEVKAIIIAKRHIMFIKQMRYYRNCTKKRLLVYFLYRSIDYRPTEIAMFIYWIS